MVYIVMVYLIRKYVGFAQVVFPWCFTALLVIESSLSENPLYVGLKLLGAGTATVSLVGSGVGIGVVFAGLMTAVSRNPNLTKQVFVYAILGFALTEAIALFGLMMSFLILFAF